MQQSPQIEVLSQLLGPEQARTVIALATLAEAVVGLNERVQALQAQVQAAAPMPAVYAPDDDNNEEGAT